MIELKYAQCFFQENTVLIDRLAKSQLCTDDVDWVPIERWEATTQINKDLFNMFVDAMSEELSRR